MYAKNKEKKKNKFDRGLGMGLIGNEDKIKIARKAYENGEAIHAIGKRLNIHVRTLGRERNKAQKAGDPWLYIPKVLSADPLTQAGAKRLAQAKIIDIATKREVELLIANGTVDKMQEEIRESLNDLRAHARLARLAMDYAEKMLEAGINEEVVPTDKQTEADVFNAIINGYGKALSVSREIAGLKAGQVSEPRDGNKSHQRRFVIKTHEEVGTPKAPNEQKE